MSAELEMEHSDTEPSAPDPDVLLAQLYKSTRPPVDLVPGLPLAPLISAAWLPVEAKVLLTETWQPAPPESEEGQEPPPPPPTFNPADATYNVMAKRLSQSAPLQQYNRLLISIKTLESALEAEGKKKEKDRDEKMREEKAAQLEADKAALIEAETQLAELKASFYEDPTCLTGWMGVLFSLADAGLTTFDVSGRFFPHTSLRSLFSADTGNSYYGGAEQVLGAFKRRFERERGPGKIQLLTRLVPNIFQDGFSGQAFVDATVDKVRQAVFGAEGTEPLDLVQLYWWDVKEGNVELTLRALQRLSEDKVEVSEESGEAVITEPRKIRAIGLIDFPPRAIIQAIQAGVPIVSLSIPFSIADRRYLEALSTAREYNIKVFARDGLLSGLINEKYVNAAIPSTTGSVDPDLDEAASALDQINNYGGWEEVKGLLKVIKKVADKHSVRMQTVALRWQIDQGTFPIVTTRWGEQQWSQFGFYHHTGPHAGLDWQLFQVDSFLDVQDMEALNALGVLV